MSLFEHDALVPRIPSRLKLLQVNYELKISLEGPSTANKLNATKFEWQKSLPLVSLSSCSITLLSASRYSPFEMMIPISTCSAPIKCNSLKLHYTQPCLGEASIMEADLGNATRAGSCKVEDSVHKSPVK
ncbi:hypothetical protein CDAR_281291 [Caerostris darwini]|uniref:Uncharacterized protein n=1 Tax=Caerostris darwini TaxID=1538125 RepID=A0AAV4WX31_9ARAC|nr:hypothetical protein CDAR_281291 [Caerostris darwini]